MWTLPALISLVTAALLLWTSGERHPYAMRLVATDEYGGGDATISPDGHRFVTSSHRTGDWELWLDLGIAGAGAEQRRALATAIRLNPRDPSIRGLDHRHLIRHPA